MAQTFNGNVNIDGNMVANNVTQDNNVQMLARTQMQFTDTSGAVNYIGKDAGTLNINTGTHILTNCTGTINYSGSSAMVYINNCPNLVVNGKDGTNWQNIWVDGVASYPDGSITMWQDGRMEYVGLINMQGAISKTFSFPVAFASAARMFISALLNNGGEPAGVSDNSRVEYTVYVGEHTTTQYFNVLAIGRWK